MREILQPEALKEKLMVLEELITAAIYYEMKRIDRRVIAGELSFSPFSEDIRDYIIAIRLGNDNDVYLDTSIKEAPALSILGCFADCKIDHWDIIKLLELLKNIS
jgi:hypothetical protein